PWRSRPAGRRTTRPPHDLRRTCGSCLRGPRRRTSVPWRGCGRPPPPPGRTRPDSALSRRCVRLSGDRSSRGTVQRSSVHVLVCHLHVPIASRVSIAPIGGKSPTRRRLRRPIPRASTDHHLTPGSQDVVYMAKLAVDCVGWQVPRRVDEDEVVTTIPGTFEERLDGCRHHRPTEAHGGYVGA